MRTKQFVLIASLFVVLGISLFAARVAFSFDAPKINSITPKSACKFDINFTNLGSKVANFEAEVSEVSDFTIGRKTYTIGAVKNQSGVNIELAPNASATFSSDSILTGYPNDKFYSSGPTYYFHIKALPVDKSEASNYSVAMIGTALSLPNVPSKPSMASTELFGNENAVTVEVNWNVSPLPSVFGGFELFMASSNDGGNSYDNFSPIGLFGFEPGENFQNQYSDHLSNPNAIPFFYSIPNLNPNLSYKFVAKSYDSGEGCLLGTADSLNQNQSVFSADSNKIVTIPRPTGLNISVTTKQVNLTWVDKSKGEAQEDRFEIWRALSDVESNYTLIGTANQNSNSYTDTNVRSGTQYFYKIKACSGSSCSIGAKINATTTPDSTSFKANVIYVSKKNSVANVEFEFPNDGKTYSVRDDSNTAVCSGQGSCYYNNAPLGNNKKFKLVSGGVEFGSLDVNLNIKNVFTGAGWGAGWDSKSKTGPFGIGWVSINSDTEKPDGGIHSSGQKYSVHVDSNGKISGAGWASIVKDSTGDHGYGWLSFNKNDLVGCPSGACEATMNSNGEISGWARFLGPKENPVLDSWDGFIHLRGGNTSVYGLCFGNAASRNTPAKIMTGETCKGDGSDENSGISGLVWAGPNVGGWIAFDNGITNGDVVDKCDPEAPVCPPCDASMCGGTTCDPLIDPTCNPGGFTNITISPTSASLVVREQKKFSASKKALWYVSTSKIGNEVLGGNSSIGSLSSNQAEKGVFVTYTAPASSGNFFVVASSTDSTRTDRAAASVSVKKDPYVMFFCDGASETEIDVSWMANYIDPNYVNYAQHSIELYGGTTNPPTKKLANIGIGNFTYRDSGLSTSTPYYYQLKTKFSEDGTVVISDVLGACYTSRPLPESSSTPGKLKVFGHGKDVLYVNWKDNATTTGAYTFEVQRIKVTPKYVDQNSEDNKLKVTAIDSNNIMLEWRNITTSTPYYHVYERSSESDISKRFINGKDSTVIKYGNSRDVGAYNNFAKIPTLPAIKGRVIGLPYDYVDSSLNEATTYYYRIMACSQIDVSSKYVILGSGVVEGKTEKPTPVCSRYNTLSTADAVSTTTPSRTPSNLSARAISSSQIELTWTDNSQKESGFSILKTNKSSGETEIIYVDANTISNPKRTGDVVYVVESLNPDTFYSFQVNSFFDVLGNQNNKAYSPYSGEAEDKTYSIVHFSAGSGGVISGDAYCNSNSCEFPDGISVTLIAIPNSGYSLGGWSGLCSGTSLTCYVSQSGDVSASFILNKTKPTIPILLSPANKSTLSSVEANTFSWQQSSGDAPITYTFEIALDPGFSPTYYSTSSITQTSHIVPAGTFQPSTKYYWRVSSWNNEGSLGWSAETREFTTTDQMTKGFFASLSANIFNGAKDLYNSVFYRNLSDIKNELGSTREGIFVRSAKYLSGIVKNEVSIINSYFDEISERFKSFVNVAIVEKTQKTEGQSVVNYDAYFKQSTTTVNAPVLVDKKDIEADTVYMYRVRVVYDGEFDSRGVQKTSDWSNLGAGKTLRNEDGGFVSGSGDMQKRAICMRNSFCDFSDTFIGKMSSCVKTDGSFESCVRGSTNCSCEDSEAQCKTNAECRDVGKSSQRFQER